jgi:hypothetical protein
MHACLKLFLKHKNLAFWFVSTGDQIPLSWLSLGLAAARRLGPSITVGLLQACCADQLADRSDDSLIADFYQTCLTLSALEQHQKWVDMRLKSYSSLKV